MPGTANRPHGGELGGYAAGASLGLASMNVCGHARHVDRLTVGRVNLFPQNHQGNVLAALPTSAHPGAKKALAEIWGAEDKQHALAAVKAFDAAYGANPPTPVDTAPPLQG